MTSPNHLTAIDAAGTANDATFTLDAVGRFRTRVVNGVTDTYSYLATSETRRPGHQRRDHDRQHRDPGR